MTVAAVNVPTGCSEAEQSSGPKAGTYTCAIRAQHTAQAWV
ncbi:hypothetical protein ZAKHE101_121 [Mycobacterium phage Zakhe101]|nr:hypothetical protein ZAKHE101_121 [Mycobacterium phage Zakhe101]